MAQRQQIEQDFDDRTGIAADMAAVGKDLPLEFRSQALGGGLDAARLAGDAERGVGERDDGLHMRHAAAGIACRVAQIAYLTHQAAQEAPVEAHIRVLQHESRLAEPGDDAPRQHIRAPGKRNARSLAA